MLYVVYPLIRERKESLSDIVSSLLSSFMHTILHHAILRTPVPPPRDSHPLTLLPTLPSAAFLLPNVLILPSSDADLRFASSLIHLIS
jgi:hypothetical protein